MGEEKEPKESPKDRKHSTPKQPQRDGVFSPRFKSVAAMAGWDEEAILIASLVVEDTPDRELKQKKRSYFSSKTPPLGFSRSKRRNQRRSPVSIPVPVLNLEMEKEEEAVKEVEVGKKKEEVKFDGSGRKKVADDLPAEGTDVPCSTSANSGLPCMDRLREELSCAICLEICFEPSTTSCGHSFCKKCLRSAADKCGKRCPKCRQLISNGRSCTVNTVLWNTIQLLFPQEVEARKAAGALNEREAARSNGEKECSNHRAEVRNRNVWASEERRGATSIQSYQSALEAITRRGGSSRRRREVPVPNQDVDAALALRLQREEFMEAFRGTNTENEQGVSSSVSVARAHLRDMATRAVSIRANRRI